MYGVFLVITVLRRLHRVVAPASQVLHHHCFDQFHILGATVLFRIMVLSRSRIRSKAFSPCRLACTAAFGAAGPAVLEMAPCAYSTGEPLCVSFLRFGQLACLGLLLFILFSSNQSEFFDNQIDWRSTAAISCRGN